MREGVANRNFPWSFTSVAKAFFRRYPNPFSKHVLSEDVISRTIDPTTGNLYTVRLISKTNKKPAWMDFIGESIAYVVEESIVDPKQQRILTRTRNINLATYLSVIEFCNYHPTPDGTATELCARAVIQSPLTIGRLAEGFGLQRYLNNVSKATEGLKWVLEQQDLLAAASQPTTTWAVPRRVDAAIGMVSSLRPQHTRG